MENLLDNALRYAKTTVNINLEKDLLEVFNDGELMSKDRIDKLFKPYEKGTKGKFGLGLSIVKKVCDTYGYNVVVNGKKDIVSVKLKLDEDFSKDDVEILEDMLVVAINDAMKKADADKAEKLGKYGQGLSGLM